MKADNKAKVKAAADKIKAIYKAKQINALNSGDVNAYISELLEQIRIKDKANAYLEEENAQLREENQKLKAKRNDDKEDKKDANDPLRKFKGYSTDWPYIEKVCFIVEKSKKPLTVQMIVNTALLLEPKLNKRLADPYKSISQAIFQGVKLERLIKGRKTGNHGHTYLINPAFSYL